MNRYRELVVVLLAAVALGSVVDQASCRTWSVERDGSADFPTIPQAMLAVTAGDTILVGEGRYNEVILFEAAGITTETHIPVSVDNLTILGVDRDLVIVGPLVPNIQTLGPRGVAIDGASGTHVETMTFENLRDGLFVTGEAVLRNLRIADCRIGVAIFSSPAVQASQLEVHDCSQIGVVSGTGTGTLVFQDCSMSNNFVGFDFNGTANVRLDRVTVMGGTGGFGLAEGIEGVVSESLFDGQSNGAVAVASGSSLQLLSSTVRNTGYGVWVSGRSYLFGSENRVSGTSFATIRMWNNSVAEFNGNDLLKGGGPLVRTQGYAEEPIVDINLSGNYWGTADADSISAWIEDGNDSHHPILDPNYSNVIFEPFLTRPVPVAKSSFGTFRSRY